jgi:hypothetical protein
MRTTADRAATALFRQRINHWDAIAESLVLQYAWS